MPALFFCGALNPAALGGIPVGMLSHAVTIEATDAACVPDRDQDHALVRAAGSGDVLAFEQLYRRHHRRVFALLRRLCGHEARAEDLLQEAFVKAWQALPGFRFESAFGTWLHRLAVNTALMELRSRRGGEDRETDDSALEWQGTPDSAGQRTALGLDLERAVATLPPRARAVLVLHDVEGWKHEEIAAELGMAVGSSKAQLHRARQLLRTRLGGHHD